MIANGKPELVPPLSVPHATVERIGELAVLSFLKIIASTNRSPVLATYRLHEGLLARMPNYRVKMGFGLHYGKKKDVFLFCS